MIELRDLRLEERLSIPTRLRTTLSVSLFRVQTTCRVAISAYAFGGRARMTAEFSASSIHFEPQRLMRDPKIIAQFTDGVPEPVQVLPGALSASAGGTFFISISLLKTP